jgi:hypothetical protein
MILETPLTVCPAHKTEEVARTLQTKENFDVIAEVMTAQGMKLDKKQLEVHFVRLADREEGKDSHETSPSTPKGQS